MGMPSSPVIGDRRDVMQVAESHSTDHRSPITDHRSPITGQRQTERAHPRCALSVSGRNDDRLLTQKAAHFLDRGLASLFLGNPLVETAAAGRNLADESQIVALELP